MSNSSEKTNFKPEIVLLYCQHCIMDGENIMAESQQSSGFSARPVMIPCSSKIEVPYILKILEEGTDGVEIVACPVNKCRFLIGSHRAEKRVEYIRRLLDEIGIGAERLGFSHGLGLSYKALSGLMAGRAKAVKTLGPNPMKKGDAS
jgi:F420-non-reducing hydrogenase iron-sulfur subunit